MGKKAFSDHLLKNEESKGNKTVVFGSRET